MTRFRIAVLIATIIFAFSLIGNHLAAAKGDQKLSAQERKLLASLDPKNTALFWQTIRKGIEILKRGGTNQEVRAAVQGNLRTLTQRIGISLMQLDSLADNLLRGWDRGRQILQEMLAGQKKLLEALRNYFTRLESALTEASRQEGRYAEVEFWNYALTADGQVMVINTPHAHAWKETEASKIHVFHTGRETHSFDAIQAELAETRTQIQTVIETIGAIENELRQLEMLIRN